jgi:hypothetical protein
MITTLPSVCRQGCRAGEVCVERADNHAMPHNFALCQVGWVASVPRMRGAEAEPNVAVRRGVGVEALVTGSSALGGALLLCADQGRPGTDRQALLRLFD